MIYFLLFFISIPAIWPLITSGSFEPHDLHHLADIFQMSRAIDLGQIPPRWAPDFTYGYGYPLFNYYYLTPFYLGALFFKLFGSLTLSLKLSFLTILLTSVFGMYKFLRLYFVKSAAFLGSVLFLYTPYRSVQVYVRGAIGEAMSLALMPLVAYSFVNLARKPTRRNLAINSLVFGIFLLTHNYMWALFMPFLGLLLLIELSSVSNKLAAIKRLAVSILLGFGVASYWIVPALTEIKHVPRLTPFLLEDHFPFMKQLVVPSWGYGSSVWGPYDLISFQIGLVNLAAISILGLISIFRNRLVKKDVKFLLWVLFGFFVSVMFMNIRTLPFWKAVPFYNLIQFPWRLLIFTTFFSSIALAVVADKFSKLSKILLPITLLIIVAINFNYFKPSGPVYKTDEQYLELFFNTEGYSEDYLLLSEWADERPSGRPESKFSIDNGEILEINSYNEIDWEAKVSASESATLTFHSYYFPGWFGRIDGKDIELIPGKTNGQIELEIPTGEHEVEIFWAETSNRKVADFTTLASILVIVYLMASPHLASHVIKSKDE